MRTTLGFIQVGLDIVTSANCKSKLWFGLDKQLSTLVIKFNFIFSISSGYRQTEYKFPTCIKPCPLYAIINQISMLKRYWLVMYPINWNGPKNFGVTAFSIDHAKSLVVAEIKRLGWTHFTETEIIQAESIENIDIRELDQSHVIPNIGVVSRQGVWYPNCNS